MTPAAYRVNLPRALAMHRAGHDLPSIVGVVGGEADWWDCLLFAASEYYVDAIQDAVADMRGGGFTIDRIALSLELSRADVLAALRTERGGAERVPRWDVEQQDAVIKDYKNGLTVPQLRRKYGFTTNSVALAAILRMQRSRK